MVPQSLPSAMEIRLFGAFDVRIGAVPLPHLRTRKGNYLLALLVLRRGRAMARDWLCGKLWPDSLMEQARGNLRRTLTDLRCALGPEARRLWAPLPDTLCFDLTDVAVDVLRFDEAVLPAGNEADLTAAVALYGGLLLEGWEEEWVMAERSTRQEAYLRCLTTLARHALERGDPVSATVSLRKAIAADPLRETVQRDLMVALVRAGDHAGALQTYRALNDCLSREWGAVPGAETTALYQALRRGEGHEADSRLFREPLAPGPREKGVHFGLADPLFCEGSVDIEKDRAGNEEPAILPLLIRIAERLDQIYILLAAERCRAPGRHREGAPGGDTE
jgi:DNA-binding SARP family transcriptional activator